MQALRAKASRRVGEPGAPGGPRRRSRRAAVGAVAFCAAFAALLTLITSSATASKEDAREDGAIALAAAARSAARPSISPQSLFLEPIRPTMGLRRARRLWPDIAWKRSRAIGRPWGGRLRNGVEFPAQGDLFVTINPVISALPNAAERRHGTHRLVWTLLQAIERYHLANPGSAPVVVGDLSRTFGGSFEPVHASHQNGLDADVYFPRLDGELAKPKTVREIDIPRAQELVNQFVLAGAEFVLVGPNTRLDAPRGTYDVVYSWPHHDNHLHVRIPASGRIQKRAADVRLSQLRRAASRN